MGMALPCASKVLHRHYINPQFCSRLDSSVSLPLSGGSLDSFSRSHLHIHPPPKGEICGPKGGRKRKEVERQNGAKLNDRDRNSEPDDTGPIGYRDRKYSANYYYSIILVHIL